MSLLPNCSDRLRYHPPSYLIDGYRGLSAGVKGLERETEGSLALVVEVKKSVEPHSDSLICLQGSMLN